MIGKYTTEGLTIRPARGLCSCTDGTSNQLMVIEQTSGFKHSCCPDCIDKMVNVMIENAVEETRVRCELKVGDNFWWSGMKFTAAKLTDNYVQAEEMDQIFSNDNKPASFSWAVVSLEDPNDG